MFHVEFSLSWGFCDGRVVRHVVHPGVPFCRNIRRITVQNKPVWIFVLNPSVPVRKILLGDKTKPISCHNSGMKRMNNQSVDTQSTKTLKLHKISPSKKIVVILIILITIIIRSHQSTVPKLITVHILVDRVVERRAGHLLEEANERSYISRHAVLNVTG